MLKLALLVLVLSFGASLDLSRTSSKTRPVSDGFIEEINRKAETWMAGQNFHPETPRSYFKALVPKLKKKDKVPCYILKKTRLMGNEPELPISFDPREKWPMCKSISMVWDQGNCGSCWAFASANAMSDRLCIHSGGKLQTLVSPDNVMSCSLSRGREKYWIGCGGGIADGGWCLWYNYGIVSGGPYGSHEGCQPYKMQPCEHHHANGTLRPCPKKLPTPDYTCHHYCENKSYKTKYSRDLTFGKAPYFVDGGKELMVELMTNGPVSASMAVHEDFLSYKSGVYKYVKGKLLGTHYIRVLGWGEENGTPYWLVANSWNSDWGDHGLFKVTRDEGSLNEFTAGLPKLGN